MPDEKIQSWEMNNAAIAPIGAHIENQRLFDMASGRLQISSSEINHLRECRMCQGVLNVFINQHRSEDTKAKGKSDSAA